MSYKPFVYKPLPPGAQLQPSHLRDTEWLFSRDPNKGLPPSKRDLIERGLKYHSE